MPRHQLMNEARRIPVDPKYVSKLGYAVYAFCYLEWGAVWLAEALKPGYVRDVKRKTAKTIAKDLVGLVEKAQASQPHLYDRMKRFSDEFKEELVYRRDKLLHANPHTAKEGEQRLIYPGKFDWTIEEIGKIATMFELASVEAGDLRKALSAAAPPEP